MEKAAQRKTGTLVLSMCLNVCLLASSVYLLNTRPRPSELSGTASQQLPPVHGSTSETTAQHLHAGFHWSPLESDDYRVYVANLRSIDCPEKTIQDIILARINRSYATKLSAVLIPDGTQPYWRRAVSLSSESFEQRRDLLKQKNEVIRSVLGIDQEEFDQNKDPTDGPLGFLNASKRRQLRELDSKYAEREQEAYIVAHGLITPEERAALAALQQQKSAEMNAVLTPQEQFECAVRTSPLSRQLEQELDAFQPTEAEFRSIYQAKAALEEKLRAPQGATGSDDTTAQEEYEAQLRSVLGEYRYADYQRSKDPGYQSLVRISDRFGLSRDIASQVFDLKLSVEAQRRELLGNDQIDVTQKQAWLQTLRDQTGANVAGLLGEKAFGLYHDLSGQWIEQLAQ